MGFYEEISKYYDYIFPVGRDQLEFITSYTGKAPKGILDVACGTGGYAIELAERGYGVTAIDLDTKMVNELRAKAANRHLAIQAQEGNMLDLDAVVQGKFDTIFCIGNSLVHLEGEGEIEGFLRGAKHLLDEKGSLIIQIINYDRVLKHGVKSLPTIENPTIGLSFKRLYRYDEESNKIFFKTILEVEGKQIENEIPLYPILSNDLVMLLKRAGFNNIKLHGDFKGKDFDQDNSYTLVLVAS